MKGGGRECVTLDDREKIREGGREGGGKEESGYLFNAQKKQMP